VDKLLLASPEGESEVLAYLKAEDAYADWFMKRRSRCRRRSTRKCLDACWSRRERAVSPRGLVLLHPRGRKAVPDPLRKKGSVDAPEKVTLDLNEMARSKEFLEINVYEVSDDGNLLAFSTDETGFRDYTLYVKDLRSGETRGEKIPHVSDAAWASNNETLFYVTEDDAQTAVTRFGGTTLRDEGHAGLRGERRPFRCGSQPITQQTVCVCLHQQQDQDEVRYLRADHLDEPLKVVTARQKDLQYNVDDDGENLFYIRTNDKGRNFRIVTGAHRRSAPRKLEGGGTPARRCLY